MTDHGLNPDIESAAAGIIRKSGEPVTVEEIAKALPDFCKKDLPAVKKAVQGLYESGKIFQWPKTRNTFKYWHTSFDLRADSTFTDLLAKKACMRSEIDTVLKKALFGVSAARVTELRIRLTKKYRKAGKLYEHPVKPPQRKTRFSFEPPDPSVYLSKVEKEIGEVCKKLNKAGVENENVFRAIIETLGPKFACIPDMEFLHAGAAGKKEPCAADLIYEAIPDVEPRASQLAPVSIPRLRRAVQIDKQRFDRAVFELAENEKIFLQRHAHPGQMTEAERFSTVTDGQGNYYVGLVLRKS